MLLRKKIGPCEKRNHVPEARGLLISEAMYFNTDQALLFLLRLWLAWECTWYYLPHSIHSHANHVSVWLHLCMVKDRNVLGGNYILSHTLWCWDRRVSFGSQAFDDLHVTCFFGCKKRSVYFEHINSSLKLRKGLPHFSRCDRPGEWP